MATLEELTVGARVIGVSGDGRTATIRQVEWHPQTIAHWDARAGTLGEQVAAGKSPRMSPDRARQRADELQARLKRRLTELDRERQLSALPPRVVGGALVVPAGLLARLRGERDRAAADYAKETERVDRAAVVAVLAAERALGRQPTEMAHNHAGYDIRSLDPTTGELLFIEVKGCIAGADKVNVKRNQNLMSPNEPAKFVLALVRVRADGAEPDVRYHRGVLAGGAELRFAETDTNYDLDDLWAASAAPS